MTDLNKRTYIIVYEHSCDGNLVIEFNINHTLQENELSSAWIHLAHIRKDENKNITSNIVLKPPLKTNMRQAVSVIEKARQMAPSERLKVYSYVKVGADSAGEMGSDEGLSIVEYLNFIYKNIF